MDADKVLVALYENPRWQFVLFVTTCVVCLFPASWHMLAIVFIGLEPPHSCNLPDPGVGLPEPEMAGAVVAVSKCHVHTGSNETLPCPAGWNYTGELFSIINQWDLVCDRAVLVNTAQTVLVVGVLVGAILTAALSDHFGRRNVMLGSVFAISVTGIVTAPVTNLYVFMALRFLTGVFQQGCILVGFVYVCEMFPASRRTVVALLMQVLWAVGMCLLALFAYFVRNWSALLYVISVPGLVAVPLFWCIPQSIPWLICKNRLIEAKQVARGAARLNGIRLALHLRLTAEEERLAEGKRGMTVAAFRRRLRGDGEGKAASSAAAAASGAGGTQKRQHTLLDVLRSRKLLTMSLIMCYLWCVAAMVYYGLSLSTSALAGDVYLNFFLSGLVEIPAYLVTAVVLQYVGRRWPLSIFFLIAGVSLFVTLFLPDDGKAAVTALAMIGKFGITGAFGAVFLYAPELFPTSIRNIGIGLASVGGRVGNLVAPFSSYIAKVAPWFPAAIFGCLSVLAALLVLLLPETLGRPLPTSIQEVEKWSRQLSKAEKAAYKKSQQRVSPAEKVAALAVAPTDADELL